MGVVKLYMPTVRAPMPIKVVRRTRRSFGVMVGRIGDMVDL